MPATGSPCPARPWPIVGGPRGAVIALAAIAFIGGTGGWLLSAMPAPPPPAPIIATERLHGLTDHHGRTLGAADLEGRVLVLFFGYTWCPDVCPMELATIALALDRLGPAADGVAPLFVTVDPGRDTPEHLADYVEAFHERLTGLTGPPAAIAEAASAFGIRYERIGEGDDYTIDHIARTLVLDGDGRLLAALPYGSPPEELVAAIRPALVTSRVASGRPSEGGI
jgi:cytochrome oxidase Cu insertion factor (SCO1/SenC/PrrC family)